MKRSDKHRNCNDSNRFEMEKNSIALIWTSMDGNAMEWQFQKNQKTKKKEDKNMKELKIKITFTDPILGSSSANKELHAEYIASKAPDAKSREEEIEAIGVDAVEKKEMTVFPRMADGRPCLWDYQIKGFFKNSCSALRMVTGTESSKMKAYKKIIDGLVFVKERQIPFEFDGEISNMQRPLRASTPMGERVALANSEMIEEGATITITILMLEDKLEDAVVEWLNYGALNGIGQWHNSGKGRFVWERVGADE